MESKTTRSSAKRNANGMSVIPEASTSPRKQPKPQERVKKEDAKPSTASASKPQPQEQSKTADAKPTSTSTKGPRIAGNGQLQLVESTGDIFDAPPNTLIIHACNTDGVWGAGIAKAFRGLYPVAFKKHRAYCRENGESLLDTAQFIPPVEHGDKAKHFVGCVFTSRHYGRRTDKPTRILEATAPAMVDLLKQVDEWNAQQEDSDKVDEVRMCKINSGLFAVPWEKTKQVLEGLDVSENDVKVIKVVSLAG